MKYTLLFAALILLAVGCSKRESTEVTNAQPLPSPEPLKPKPKAGDKLELARNELFELWDDLDALRKARSLEPDEPPGNYATPEYKAVISHVREFTEDEYLVEVIEVGEDFATVHVISSEDGEPINLRGYALPWWKPR